MPKVPGRPDPFRLAVIALLLGWVYAATSKWLVDGWTDPDTYYAHGPLVPMVSAFLLWRQRKELAGAASSPSPWGVRLIILGLGIQLLSAVWRIYFTSAVSFFILLIGLILASGGWGLLKKVWFPVAFLLFMVPMPLSLVASFSLFLKIVAAKTASALIWAMGIPVWREGSVLYLPHSTVLVEDLCSGLRSLIALVALGVLVAYFHRAALWKRLLILSTAVPVALSANVFRIVALSLGSELYGALFAGGLFHDVMGLLSFLLAYGVLVCLSWWLR